MHANLHNLLKNDPQKYDILEEIHPPSLQDIYSGRSRYSYEYAPDRYIGGYSVFMSPNGFLWVDGSLVHSRLPILPTVAIPIKLQVKTEVCLLTIPRTAITSIEYCKNISSLAIPISEVVLVDE